MEAFASSVDRLLNQVAHWEQARWWCSSGQPRQTKADLVYALVQRLADLGSEAESRNHRQVPRLSDLTLPDQLRVMADDLLAADPPADILIQATGAVDRLRQTL